MLTSAPLQSSVFCVVSKYLFQPKWCLNAPARLLPVKKKNSCYDCVRTHFKYMYNHCRFFCLADSSVLYSIWYLPLLKMSLLSIIIKVFHPYTSECWNSWWSSLLPLSFFKPIKSMFSSFSSCVPLCQLSPRPCRSSIVFAARTCVSVLTVNTTVQQ